MKFIIIITLLTVDGTDVLFCFVVVVLYNF